MNCGSSNYDFACIKFDGNNSALRRLTLWLLEFMGKYL